MTIAKKWWILYVLAILILPVVYAITVSLDLNNDESEFLVVQNDDFSGFAPSTLYEGTYVNVTNSTDLDAEDGNRITTVLGNAEQAYWQVAVKTNGTNDYSYSSINISLKNWGAGSTKGQFWLMVWNNTNSIWENMTYNNLDVENAQSINITALINTTSLNGTTVAGATFDVGAYINSTNYTHFMLFMNNTDWQNPHGVTLDFIEITFEYSELTGTILEQPEDNYATYNTTVDFRCSSAHSGTSIDNVTFYLWDSASAEYATTYRDLVDANAQNETFNVASITNDTYSWNCEYITTDSVITRAGSNYTLTMDTTKPSVDIRVPLQDIITFNSANTSSLNITATDTNLDNCWYFINEDHTNTTFTCASNTTITFPTSGGKTIYVFANDTAGNEHMNTTTFNINDVLEKVSYRQAIFEGDLETIILNLSANSITSLSGNIRWNNSNSTALASYNSTFAKLNASVLVPTINTPTEFYFNFTYSINGVNRTTATYNSNATVLTAMNITTICPTDLTPSRHFDFKEEQNLTVFNNTVAFNFKYGVTNNTAKTFSSSLTNVEGFYICTNTTVGNYSVGYGEIQYEKTGYVDRRNYLFEDTLLTTVQVNETLYSLPSTDSTSFLFEFKTSALVAYENKYTKLLRWYPDYDEYRTVDMGKTDNKGETVMHVVTEDVDYRIGLYELNGTLINLADPVRMVCQTTPCEYSLLIAPGDVDYTSIFGIDHSLTFNNNTRVFSFIWSDPSSNTDSMTLKVYKETGFDSIEICNNVGAGATGALSCNVSAYTGTIRAIAYRTASPEVTIAQKIVNILDSIVFQGVLGLFIALVIFVTLVLAGIVSPVLSVILGVMAFIPAVIFGVINVEIAVGLGVIGALVIHFMKRVSQ